MSDIVRVETISQMIQMMGLKEPMHPLVYVVDMDDFHKPKDFKSNPDIKVSMGFYSIFLKDAGCAMQYGRNTYDFDEGVLSFIAPGQVIGGAESNEEPKINYGWGLFFHPDLIRKSTLGKKIEDYHFFSYEVHEALHLSKKEEDILNDCIKKIEFELDQNIDAHSQQLLISNIELLLNYCNRFYERQFHTRSDHHKDVVSVVEGEIKKYFDQNLQTEMGLPTTKFLAEKVNLSPNYLGDLLKKETGKNTKEHINDYVVNKAKTILLNTENNVSEIAYDLGFNYPHYFSRLFKQKTGMTPAKYRDLNLN
ncbi:MAG: helix-turn-helix transcriptional regulator [Flavobacteriales bacterium]|nr:helix-turn-helix transcriptional regulator [Flavobacteriales bacterium]